MNLGEGCKVISCFHFNKEPSRSHGIPFQFVVKHGETLGQAKGRLQERLGIPEKDFSKIKFWFIPTASYGKQRQIEDGKSMLFKL